MFSSKFNDRTIFVSAGTSSGCGITASVHQEPATGDHVIDAGALVLADNGICIIDELDKCADKNSLLDAMEQQKVFVAKAGLVCSLSSRCSVLAAANPIGGHFDPRKTFMKNISLSEELINRFDMLFALNSKNYDDFSTDLLLENEKYYEEILSFEVLKNYLNYVRYKFKPKFSEEAENTLLYDNDMWQKNPRILNTCIRMAKARAKLDFSDIISKEHVQECVQLLKYARDSCKKCDLPIVAKNKQKSKKLLMQEFKKKIAEFARSKPNLVLNDLKNIYVDVGASIDTFDSSFDNLANCGILLKNSDGSYRIFG